MASLFGHCLNGFDITELARGTLRGKLPQLHAALEGRVQPHHRMLLQHIFAHLQFVESSIQQVLQEIAAQMEPYQAVVELLQTHPGVQAVAAMRAVLQKGECSDKLYFKNAEEVLS